MQFLYFLLLAPLAAAQTGREPGGARSLSCCQIDRIGTAPFFINTRESDYTMSCCGRYEYKGNFCIHPNPTAFNNCCTGSGVRPNYITCTGEIGCASYNVQCGPKYLATTPPPPPTGPPGGYGYDGKPLDASFCRLAANKELENRCRKDVENCDRKFDNEGRESQCVKTVRDKYAPRSVPGKGY